MARTLPLGPSPARKPGSTEPALGSLSKIRTAALLRPSSAPPVAPDSRTLKMRMPSCSPLSNTGTRNERLVTPLVKVSVPFVLV